MNAASYPAPPSQASELLEAAVQAANAGEEDRSFELLQRSVAASHLNPAAHYLLGADYAQRRHYGDAVLHMTTAVEQAPQLWVARVQLGLLWLTLRNPHAAQGVLQPLAQLPSSDALRLFGEGLLALAADELSNAARQLSAGLEVGVPNPPLMADMRRLLEAVQGQQANGATSVEAVVSHGMAISAYTGSDRS
jgi:tetratricopeptide (TPR) repeat protein